MIQLPFIYEFFVCHLWFSKNRMLILIFPCIRWYSWLIQNEGARQMMKEMLIEEINRMMKESNDEEMLQLIYLLLLKSSEK
jgi:hypothetical protein